MATTTEWTDTAKTHLKEAEKRAEYVRAELLEIVEGMADSIIESNGLTGSQISVFRAISDAGILLGALRSASGGMHGGGRAANEDVRSRAVGVFDEASVDDACENGAPPRTPQASTNGKHTPFRRDPLATAERDAVDAIRRMRNGAPTKLVALKFAVILTRAGDKTFDIVRAVRHAKHCSISTAENLIDEVQNDGPQTVFSAVTEERANELRELFEAAGATVETRVRQ